MYSKSIDLMEYVQGFDGETDLGIMPLCFEVRYSYFMVRTDNQICGHC